MTYNLPIDFGAFTHIGLAFNVVFLYICREMKRFLLFGFFMLLAFDLAIGKGVAYLAVPVDFDIVNGNFDASMVYVRRDNKTVITVKGKRNLELRLDFNTEYVVDFTKPGYITKTIEINTRVPEKRRKNGFEPYKIGVRLFKQYEGINYVVFNQPVALIAFLPEVDDFGYSTDYTKTILSELQRTTELLELKAMEERDLPEYVGDRIGNSVPERRNSPSRTTHAWTPVDGLPDPPVNDSVISSTGSSGTGLDESNRAYRNRQRREPQKVPPGPPGSEDLPPITSARVAMDMPGSDNVWMEGRDFSPSKVLNEEQNFRSVETIVEDQRVILVTYVQRGSSLLELRMVKYAYGETYYFMNGNVSISEHLYEYLTRSDPSF